eukprot:CAMPEP_0172450110 /NCGR_PEP_ID=MMETSP1065-20121228/8598_1 /TAXON_ID=265537 /ORGANISM="Amphiprora paludosa, Strain CCMP125" /LENGTH=321 /DNA_ID=CAMNT_0013201883 /DNA_START=118 /DNA_END=1083 /DNA_ORIENTATION=+
MKINGDLPIPRDVIQQILDSPIPYETEEIEQQSKDLLATLTKPEEVDVAAQSSYAYWLATLSDQPPTEGEREKMALREMRRHLAKTTFEKAQELLQGTIQIRMEHRIDIIRACFMESIEYDSEEDEKLAKKMRSMIELDLKDQICVVRGHDKEKLAILTIFARTAKGNSDEAFLFVMLYAMERATAATEFLSLGANEKLMVVLDFGSFKASSAPSWNASKAVAMVLQHHFPERLRRLLILDPPFWLRTMYAMVSPFLDPLTKAKFQVCSGERQKRKVIAEFVDADQAMPFMLPDGKLVGDVVVPHYTRNVPFHEGYHNPPK